MQSIQTLILSTIFAGAIYGCASGSGSSSLGGQSPAIEACVSRGISYFKEIGSYPRLFSLPDRGRHADDVARERCNLSPRAFP